MKEEEFINKLLEKSKEYTRAYNTFLFLYLTGCRCSEVIDLTFKNYTGTTIEIYTKKTKRWRTLYIKDYPENMKKAIINSDKLFFLNSYSSIQKNFKSYSPCYTYRNNKEFSTHLFRHNKFKSLYKSGFTEEQVSDILSEKAIKNTQGYINSKITFV